ncbi:MAG: NAD(+) diphosphatase [Methanolobus sp.]
MSLSKKRTKSFWRSHIFRREDTVSLPGFVEPGESIEQAVVREVREEVGISVKKVKYFGSQPWPFPDSLMIGFTAEHLEGDIQVDGIEIEYAGWFLKMKFQIFREQVAYPDN